MVDRLNEGTIFVKIAPLDYKGLYNAIYCIFFHFLILDVLQNLQGNYLKWSLKYMRISSFILILDMVFRFVVKSIFRAHVEGQLKVNIDF